MPLFNLNTGRYSVLAAVAALLMVACGANVVVGGVQPTSSPTATEQVTATAVPTTIPTEQPSQTPTPTPAPQGLSAKNAPDLVELRTIEVASAPITAVAFSPVDHHVATFGTTNNVDIYDADSGQRVYHLTGHADWGMGMAYSPDGTKLASGARGSDIILWDVQKGQRIVSLQAAPYRVYDLAWAPEGDRFAVVGELSSRVTIFGAGGNKIQELKTPGGYLWSVAWSKDFLAVASNDVTKRVYVYDARTFGSVADVYTELPAGELDFSPDGKLLLGCLRDGTIHIWDTANWTEVRSWEAHPRKGYALGCLSGAFSKDGSVYFSGGDNGNLIAWDVATGNPLKTFEYGVLVWSISLSGDGTLLAAGLDNGQVKIIGLK